MYDRCGDCVYFDWNDKKSIGCRCTNPEMGKRREWRKYDTSYYKAPSTKCCKKFERDPNVKYIPNPRKGAAKKGMHYYYVAFIGTNKSGCATYMNDEVMFNESDLSMDDLREIHSYLEMRNKLKNVVILNIFEVRK